MRSAAVSALIAGGLVWPMAAAAQTPSPADAAVLEAWRVADCDVIATAVATMEPGEVWKQQALQYKEYLSSQGREPRPDTLGPVVRGRYGRATCPDIPTAVPVADGARFETPTWSADYSKVWLMIQMPPRMPSTGRWRIFVMARDGGGWRVEQSFNARSEFHPTTVDEII